MYLPYAQHPVDEFTIAVRTPGDPMAFAPTLRRDVAAIDRELPIAEDRTDDGGHRRVDRRAALHDVPARRVRGGRGARSRRSASTACSRIWSTQRTQEIGVRLAIGAAPRDVVRLFVRRGRRLTVVGLACRPRRRARRDARAGDAALRRHDDRPGDVRRRRRRAGAGRAAGELRAGAARRAGRSDDGAPKRLAAAMRNLGLPGFPA